MTSQARSALYQLEKEIQQAYVKGARTDHLSSQQNQLLSLFCVNSSEKLTKYLNQMVAIVRTINISSSVLQLGEHIDTSRLSNPITDLEFVEAKNYVQELLDVDLTDVSLEFTEKNEHMVEGRCLSCGDTSHIVLIPKNDQQVCSTDLLVHELGHAAEFTFNRKSGDDKLLLPHASFSEAIAYYCQLKYLVDKGTREQRIGAFGVFYLSYLAACVVRHCLDKKIELNELKPNKALKSGYYDDILAAYPSLGLNVAKKIVIDNIKFFQERYGSILHLMHGDFSPRLGFVFALYLLDKPKEFLQDLMLQNALENDFLAVTKTIVPSIKEFAELDKVLLAFYGE